MKQAFKSLRTYAGILANSSFLALGTVVASGLGFVYWWVAARAFPPAAVGAQAALISAMGFVGMFGEVGFGTLLLSEAGNRKRESSSLIAAASVAGTTASLLLALLATGILRFRYWMTGTDALLFVIGCALTGFGLVIDNGFIGLGQSRLQFFRSLMFSGLKLVFLVIIGLVTQTPSMILLTWVGSLVVSLVVSCGHAWGLGVLRLVRPNFRGLLKLVRVVIDHHALNLSAAAPGLILPVVVNTCLSPAVNAAFYTGWMVRAIAMLVSGSLTTVLFSLDSSEPDVMRQNIRFSLTLSLAVGAAGVAGFALFGDLVLRIFNPAYPALAGAAMPLFGLSLIGGSIRQHYVLIARVRRKMMRGALWLAMGGCAELGLATLGGLYGNVWWLTLGWLVALTGSAALLLKPLLAYLHPRPAPRGAINTVSP